MSYCMYRARSGAIARAWRGLAGASKRLAGVLGPARAMEDPGLMDPRGSL